MNPLCIQEREKAAPVRAKLPRVTGRCAGRGFTLIELLVVIAIIGILAALLFPSLTRARQRALQTKCLSNLRQIQIACVNYASNNRGNFPTATRDYGFPHEFKNVTEVLGPFLTSPRDKIMFCPGPLQRVRSPATPLYDTHYITYQYFNFNASFLGTYGGSKPNLTTLEEVPAGVALWGCLSVKRADGTSIAHNEPGVAGSPSGMSAAYPDGHASWVDIASMEVYWKGGGSDYYWPIPPAP